jgi:hypothetical protein
MRAGRHLATAALAACLTGGPALATDLEEVVAQHMVGQALLAAHLVAIAEKAGMPPAEINAILRDVAERSAIAEFWITDANGHAYLTNSGVDFTFEPDPARQPQASAFWPLITGEAEVVVQQAQRREIDDQVFKYIGVAGVDQPRIVQVGVEAASLPPSR